MIPDETLRSYNSGDDDDESVDGGNNNIENTGFLVNGAQIDDIGTTTSNATLTIPAWTLPTMQLIQLPIPLQGQSQLAASQTLTENYASLSPTILAAQSAVALQQQQAMVHYINHQQQCVLQQQSFGWGQLPLQATSGSVILPSAVPILPHRVTSRNQQYNQQQQQQHIQNNIQQIVPLGNVSSQQFSILSANQVTHNLIPAHLQVSAMAPSLDGLPGHIPALILSSLPTSGIITTPPPPVIENHTSKQVLTVQDRPMVAPVYNGVNPNYPGLRVVNATPPVYCVDNFLTPFECDFLINVAQDAFGPAPIVGKGAGEISPSRTSSTCFLAREDLPDYVRKVSVLTGRPIEHCELPQVGRYFPSQQYHQHFDAFDYSEENGRRFAANGGQRTITILVYLNDVPRGGATRFPALNMDVQPRKGMACVFFPATIDGFLDQMALHAALPAVDTKYVSQVWVRQSVYNGTPSKRLPHTLGVPFGQEAAAIAATNEAAAAAAAAAGLVTPAGLTAAQHPHYTM